MRPGKGRVGKFGYGGGSVDPRGRPRMAPMKRMSATRADASMHARSAMRADAAFNLRPR
jgi:hypothetical protein